MASPFLAGFPGGLMESQQFAQQQELRRLQLQQALQEQQTLGAIGRTLRQNPQLQLGGFPGSLSAGQQQPTGYQAGVGQDIATSLAGGPSQGGGIGPDALILRDALAPPSGADGGFTPGSLNWARKLSPNASQSPQLSSYGGAAGIAGLPGGPSGPSLPGLVAQMESSGGRDVASQPAGMVDKVYGQYPGFVSEYGAGPQGVMNFANRMLQEKPNATVGDFYSNYVLGTGGTSKTPADLAATTVPGAQGAYRNMENKLASAGVSDVTPLHLMLDRQLGQGGAKLVQAGMPAPAVQASTQTAQAAGRLIDPQQWGRSQLPDIFAAVDRANPKAPDAVKVLAAMQLNKLAAPEERLIMQMWAKERSQDIQLGLAQFRAAAAEERAREAQGNIAGIYQSGGQTYGVTRGGQVKPLDLPADAAKIGTKPPGGGVSDLQAEWVANYIQTTGQWPVGSGRNQALQNKVEQILAAKGVDPQQIARAGGTFKADQTSLAAAQKLADATASYEKTALKNLGLATEQIHKAAPTNFGPLINKWIETGETFEGNTTVPKSVAAVVTLANEYAKVMSGATGAQAATDSSRREAAEILNPYFSSGQWDEVASLIQQEMGNRIASLNDQVDVIRARMGRGGQVGPPAAEKAPAVGPSTSTPTATPTVTRNATKEQYDALPRGAHYTMPGDSNEYVKQ